MHNSIIIALIATVTGSAFGILWLRLIRTCRMKKLLYIYMGLILVANVLLLIVNFLAAIVGVILMLMTLLWLYLVRDRIPFSEAIIKASTKALQDHYGAIVVSYVITFATWIWIGLWSFDTLVVYNELKPIPNEGSPGPSGTVSIYYFLLLIPLFWTCEVLKNVGHTTTAGTVASWWLQPHSPSPTMNALKRSLTTSFGSICLGSLLVAILKALREILYQAERNARESENIAAACLLCCAQWCLGWIESLIEYFNVYAYTYVAVYGDDYVTSAKKVIDLFKRKGFTLLINDDLTGMVLTLGMLLGGIVAALVSGFWAVLLKMGDGQLYSLIGVGFIIGMLLTAQVCVPVQSAVNTTFVCWAEDSNAMKNGRPDMFQKINNAAEQRKQVRNNGNN